MRRDEAQNLVGVGILSNLWSSVRVNKVEIFRFSSVRRGTLAATRGGSTGPSLPFNGHQKGGAMLYIVSMSLYTLAKARTDPSFHH